MDKFKSGSGENPITKSELKEKKKRKEKKKIPFCKQKNVHC